MPTLTLSGRAAADIAVDALIVGARAGDQGAELLPGHGLPKGSAEHLATSLEALEAKGTVGEVARLIAVPGVKAGCVAVTGVGPTVSVDTLRDAAANAVRQLASRDTIAVALPADDTVTLGAIADGAYAGAYSSTKVTSATSKDSSKESRPGAPRVTVLSELKATKANKGVVARAEVLGRARDWARDLVNLPPNLLFPQSFAEAAKSRARSSSAKVTVSVLDEKALAKGGFGGIVGVGQGSANPPRIVTMSWKPVGAKASIALVGKGITFDSGGLCIKPAASMLTMKSDMAGAAVVAAAVMAAAELDLPVAVTGYLCLAENMPSGTAQRPSDVVTMRNHKTVEIIDTDAEGRMVLADGLCLAGEKAPDAIVDIATLTGAQMIALGAQIAGVMANDDAFRDRVVAAAQSAGEQAWPMPLPEALRKGLESQIADLAHKADRYGGMLTAGLFLEAFVEEGTPWAHVDIAGPSFNEKGASGMSPKGGTGYGVSTLVALVEQYSLGAT